MGLPGERDEDIVAIANLADHVLELGRSVVPKARRGSISVSISVSVFIPKAATPFQWCPQLDYDDVKRRQKLLITSVRNRAVRVHYHDAETSLIEAALSRAGRDMTPVIIDAWRAGSRFDAWVEHFSLDNWKEAAAKNGIDLNELVHLPYELDWRLPWEHVSPRLHARLPRARVPSLARGCHDSRLHPHVVHRLRNLPHAPRQECIDG